MEQVVKQEKRSEQRINRGAADEPSARQRAYIQALASAAGLKMDVSTIVDRQKATRIIDSLKLLNARASGNVSDVRDKRVAFGNDRGERQRNKPTEATGSSSERRNAQSHSSAPDAYHKATSLEFTCRARGLWVG
ncbi:MAG: hypothetical protein HY459_01305 [Parcubacteria group bacterium]|nr:hypothetical protein [Parcubacteria group bacterium]